MHLFLARFNLSVRHLTRFINLAQILEECVTVKVSRQLLFIQLENVLEEGANPADFLVSQRNAEVAESMITVPVACVRVSNVLTAAEHVPVN